MHAQSTTTSAQANEATPIRAKKAMSASLGAPARRPAISRIYPSDLKARAEALAAVDTGNDRWPELLERLSEVSDAAVEALRQQKNEGWDLDLAAKSILACGEAIAVGAEAKNYGPIYSIIEEHQSRVATRDWLSEAARKWIEIFRAEGGRFVSDRDVGAFGAYCPRTGMSANQRRYIAKLEKLAFPTDDDGGYLPSALGDAVQAEAEADHLDLIATRPTRTPIAPASEFARPEWDAAVARYQTTKSANDAFCAQSDEAQDEQEEVGNEIFRAYCDAVHDLETAEPPTTEDLAVVIRAQIELSGLDYAYQSIDCPNTFSDFLASQDDTVASRARAYLSLLRAVGSDNPALGATLWDRFPAEEYGPFKVEERRAGWLAHHERRRAAAFAGQPTANLIAAE